MTFGKSKDGKDIMVSNASSSSGNSPRTLSGDLAAFLGQGSKVVGNLTFSGPVEVDGYIEGEVKAEARLTIGDQAVINAKVVGSEILVKGTVNGDIIASKRLALMKPAKVVGNIQSTNLSIEEGVIFEGKCSMDKATQPASKAPTDAKTGRTDRAEASA